MDAQAADTAPTTETVQAEISRLRRSVLSGRGPGASPTEFLRSTRGRALIGELPVPLEREAVARAAAAARRDADVLALQVAAAQFRVSESIGSLRHRRATAPGKRRVHDLRGLARSRRPRLPVGVVAVIVGGLLVVRRKRRVGRGQP